MELKDFVSQTLVGIIQGVTAAQQQTHSLGAHVNPGGLMRTTQSIADNSIWDNTTNNYARTVDFDVVVTVEDEKQTTAKINVLGGFLDLGAGGSSGNKQQAVNRIRFSVPVLFPVSDVGYDARKSKSF